MCGSIVSCARVMTSSFFFFFFQAEDGIRDLTVTGVQTCALPICCVPRCRPCGPWWTRRPLFRPCRRWRSLRRRSPQLPPRLLLCREVLVGLLAVGGGQHALRVVAQLRHAQGEIGRASCRERV